MGARGLDQAVVAAERQRDPVGDVEPGLLARVLDRVHDLARQPLAQQLVVELQRQRHRASCLGLDLVAVERLHHQGHVVGLERVLGAVDVDPDPALALDRLGDVAGSSASTAAATCGIALPKRGPRVRKLGLTE